jgi:hypothetical protein
LFFSSFWLVALCLMGWRTGRRVAHYFLIEFFFFFVDEPEQWGRDRLDACNKTFFIFLKPSSVIFAFYQNLDLVA